MAEEYDIFRQYLQKGINVITGCEKYCSEKWLGSFLKNLKPYECPDMIAELDNEVVIFEHFQFDGTKKTNKGMKGIQEESKIQSEINDFFSEGEDGTFITNKNEKESGDAYWNNLRYVFQKHYDKIDNYKDNLNEININNKKIMVGFCIENRFFPIAQKQTDEGIIFKYIRLIELSEFLDILEESKDLDFVFLCGVDDCKHKAIYINKKMIPYLREISYSIRGIEFWNGTEKVASLLMKELTEE